MNKILVLFFILLFPSCKETPTQPQQPLSLIVAYVHWENQGLAGKQIVLVQKGDTLRTDSNGLANFSVPAGHYIVRAFHIQRGGPSPRFIDFDVYTHPGEIARVDIIDCLPCL